MKVAGHGDSPRGKEDCAACQDCRNRALTALQIAEEVKSQDDARLRRIELVERLLQHISRADEGDTVIGSMVQGLRRDVDAQARALTEVRSTIGLRLQEAVRATWRAWARVLA